MSRLVIRPIQIPGEKKLAQSLAYENLPPLTLKPWICGVGMGEGGGLISSGHFPTRKNNNKKKRELKGYLKVFKNHPPLVGWIFGRARREKGPPVAGDRLAAVRVFRRSVDVPAAVEDGLGAIVLQLHHVQCEPVASGHLVVALTHHKAADKHTFHQCKLC